MWAQEYWIDEDEPQHSSGMMTGLFVGLAIGAAAAVLMTSTRGAELRSQVQVPHLASLDSRGHDTSER